MSRDKTERLLNLVICLLSTRHPLTKVQIRQAVPQYYAQRSTETFDRMFERDKDELRELGVPVELTEIDPGFHDELGYRVDRAAYEVPQLSFEPDELAVLGLAARVWQQASLGHPARLALAKLTALGVPADAESLIGIQPRVHTTEPAFEPMWQAVRDRTPVTFWYHKLQSASPTQRQLQPWSVTNLRGRWYVVGFDVDRQDSRIFRLSRVTGPVLKSGPAGSYPIPPDEVKKLLHHNWTEPATEPTQVAVLRVQGGAGYRLRQRARSVTEMGADHIRLEVEYTDPEAMAAEILTLADKLQVISPKTLRDRVLTHLTALRDGATHE